MKRTTKEIAARIEPTYHRVWHPLRRMRTLMSAAAVMVGIVWAVVGGDSLHNNGPLSASHAAFEDDCARCHGGVGHGGVGHGGVGYGGADHEASYHSISDETCSECHSVTRHQETVAEPACAQCHREHRGRDGLARVGDAHCNACHTHHSSIRSLLTHDEFDVEPRPQNIRFDHTLHLKPELLGGPIACADCHQPREGGHRPIRFDAHCVRCHTERLDEDIADETVPHGVQPDKLQDWIAAVYLRRMREDRSLVRRTETDEIPTWAEALAKRSERALRGLVRPGRKGGCLICHMMVAGRITLPAIPTSWHTGARFDHRPHKSNACAVCHDMRSNKTAADLSLPGVANCRECHSRDAVADSCVTCHPYHR